MADEKQQLGRKPTIEPFTVEFGDDNNSAQFTINALRQMIRGRFVMSRVRHKANQEMMSMPDVPGQRMRVVPRDSKVEVFDPLEKDKQLMERISMVARRARVDEGAPYCAVEKVTKKVDPDTLKTLLLELIYKAEIGQCQLVDGTMPDRRDVERLDGRELYDTWNSSSRKPKYREDVENWEKRLESQGV